MRLPGAWYVLGDGNFHSRSHIVKTPSTGKRLSFEALEKAIAEAEHVRGLSALDAIPEARWRDQPVQEMMSRLFPEETAKRQQHTTNHRETVQNFERSQYPEHTFEEIRAALSKMPPRRGGLQTYKEDRLVMCGLAAAIEEIGLEVGHVFTLLDEFGWEGWDAEKVLDTSTVRSEGYFWNHAKKCGHDSFKWRRERERDKKTAAQEKLIDEIKALHEERVAGAELLDALMKLSVETGLPITQLQKVFAELDQTEQGVERMSEALDLITAAKDEPISVEELVPDDFNAQVIEDFRKGVEASPLLILMLVLTVMSSVLPVGTKVRLLDYTNHDQAVLLYFLILTMSGGKKTLLFDELVEKPIMVSDIKSRADKKFRQVRYWQAQAKAKKAQKQKKEQSKAIDEQAIAAPEEGKGEAQDSSQSVPVQPLRHVVSDFTGEGLDRNCQQAEAHYSHGFLIGTDEGRQLLAGDQYKGGNSTYTTDKLTRLYDGKGGNQVRGDSRNERHYTSSHVAIAALLQPEIYDEIAAEAADDESGFWPRFLTVESAPVKMRRGTLEELQAAKQKTYPEVLSKLYDYCNQLGSHTHRNQLGQQPHFRFSDEAQEWWVKRAWEIEDQQEQHATNGDPMVARVMGKAAGQVGRLAALLHILERAFNGGIEAEGTPSVEIPLATVQKAYRLQARLMARTIRQRIRATGTGTKDDTQLLNDIQRRCLEKDPKGEGLKIGAIERFWNQRNRPSKEELYQAVTALASAGFGELRLSTSNRGGFVYTALKPLAA